jgi:hypothetical protein
LPTHLPPAESPTSAREEGRGLHDDVVVLRQSEFADAGSAGFGVAYIRDRDRTPQVGLAIVDFATKAEDTVAVRPGESFGVAGEVWQLAEVRNPAQRDWEVVLRRVRAAR